MLKQEEALTELDASIDDWVNKLEQAENRRTRVRQKLLEHVAAAACLPIWGSTATQEPPMTGTSTSGIGYISTPPRSPSKESPISPRNTSNSPSPHRVVAQVPSTIVEQPVIEEQATKESDSQVTSPVSLKRADVESIRIYAGDDVYSLLADVEDEITKMSKQVVQEPTPHTNVKDTNRIAIHRQRSHELLNGLSTENHSMKRRDFSEGRAISPLAPTPMTTTSTTTTTNNAGQNEPPADDLPLLANVVYRP
jgi:hypothetical protein